VLDGRFADVNRRVGDLRGVVEEQGDALTKLDRDLAAHSTTQNEALSYTAVAVRRMEEQLAAHEDVHTRLDQILAELARMDERSYVERLDRVAQGPLSGLDGALANAINLAAGHTGFASEAGLWFNSAVTVELGEGRAEISHVNERIVELPFAFGKLAGVEPGARVLDVGGAESTFALSAASLGYRVTVVDPQGLAYEHPNLTTFAGRLEEWEPTKDEQPFAAAFLISAIEHFGLGAYGERAGGEQADRQALERIRDLLGDGGLLVLTTPYGTPSVDALERVYDDAALDELLAGWHVLERAAVARADSRTWLPGEGSAGTVLVAATSAPPS
jgi:hypothetical protein